MYSEVSKDNVQLCNTAIWVVVNFNRIYERDLHLPILQEIHDPWEGEMANHQPAPNEGSASCSSRVGLKHGRSKSLKLVAMVLVGVDFCPIS